MNPPGPSSQAVKLPGVSAFFKYMLALRTSYARGKDIAGRDSR